MDELDKLKKSANKAKDVEKEKLESDISQLDPKIKQLGSELKNARDLSNSKFEFKAPATLPSSKKKEVILTNSWETRENQSSKSRLRKRVFLCSELFSRMEEVRYLAVSDWTHVSKGARTPSA